MAIKHNRGGQITLDCEHGVHTLMRETGARCQLYRQCTKSIQELLGPIMQVLHLYGCLTSDIAESILCCIHMRPITWLHISDFHFREEEAWAQNTVLRAMLDDIQRRCENELQVDFVLATGDLAYSGDEAQYLLARHFLCDLTTTA